jgi:tetratricopeptide (TPR) repeat protein
MIHAMGSLTRLLFVVSLVVVVLPAVSCKREEPKREAASTPSAAGPYSDESVFGEVQSKLRENPNDPDALYHLGDLYERSAQYPQAIEAYKKVVALKPDMGYAYFKIGTAYNRIDKPAEAAEAFEKAVKYLPGFAVAYNNLGVAYGKLGKLDEEIAVLKKAIELRPSYAVARYNLGMTLLKKGDKKAATKEYEALKELDEGIAEALMKEINSSS